MSDEQLVEIWNRPENVAKDLERAAAYLEIHGWTQGVAHDEQGRACVIGALAMTSLGTMHGAVDAFRKHLCIEGSGPGVSDWNDAEHRTAELVIKELRACAADLRAGSEL